MNNATTVRAAITAEIQRQEKLGIYTGITNMDPAVMLSTRMQVAGVCAALDLTPDDGVIVECEDGIDRAGWTYFTQHGELAYMVKYDNGMIGAEFGAMRVYASTLKEAERQMIAILLPNAEA